MAPTELFAFVANLGRGRRVEPEPRKQAAAAMACRNCVAAEAEYGVLVASKPQHLALHRAYLTAHFGRPKRASRKTPRGDTVILKEYAEYAAQPNRAMSGLGNYGLGLT